MNTQTSSTAKPAPSQGILFATLPRQLPILKSGPEDEPKPVTKH
jgi:hypothetical protein